MYPGIARYRRVARVGPPDVRAAGGLESRRVILFIEESVVTSRVCPQCGIVVDRAEGQGCAAAPAPHQLCRQEFLLLRAGRVRLEVAAERRHTLVQLPEDDIGAVAAQDLGLRPLDAAHLVGIAQHEFARLQGLFLGIGSRNAAPFDSRMADTVPESEGLLLSGQRVAVMAPDRRNPWRQLPVRLPSALEHRLEPRTIRR